MNEIGGKVAGTATGVDTEIVPHPILAPHPNVAPNKKKRSTVGSEKSALLIHFTREQTRERLRSRDS